MTFAIFISCTCDEEELQLIFLEDSGTLVIRVLYMYFIAKTLCAVQFENILCTCVHVYGVL